MTALDRDIEATKATLAKIADKLKGYPPEVLTDLGAHLRAIEAQARDMIDGKKKGDKLVTEGLKQILRPEAEAADGGFIVLGKTFQAVFAPCTMQVLNQSELKEAHPKIYAAFIRPITSERLNFAVRKG